MVKQKVGRGVLRHAESKSGLCFVLPLLSFTFTPEWIGETIAHC